MPRRNKLSLNKVELGGGNVESIDIGGEARESLLGAVWSDEGVDLDALHVVLLLESGSDLALVGLDIDDEDEGVVLLDLCPYVSLRVLAALLIYFVPSSWRTRC
jgi:hypothetical protein